MKLFTAPIALLLFFCYSVEAQINSPVNGVYDQRHTLFALQNGIIHTGPGEVLSNKIMLVKDDKIVGFADVVPANAVSIDCKERHIYPAFIDASTSYGISENTDKMQGDNSTDRPDPGARHWNMAVHPEYKASETFRNAAKSAESLRKLGFSTVNSIRKDGLFRGSSCVASLANQSESKSILNDRATQAISFSKGSSRQEYPSSLVGSVALIRQTFLDAQWYKTATQKKVFNASLQAMGELQSLPVVFETQNGQDAIRAASIANEFGFNLWVDGTGEEYQHIDAMTPNKVSFIVPLNFPEAFDVTDIQASRVIPLSTMMHWESAAANAALLHRRGFSFALTARGVSDEKMFLTNLRRIVAAGLPEKTLLEALTTVPAKLLGVDKRCGLIKPGYDASFIICSDSLLHPENTILENWALGQRMKFDNVNQLDINGVYRGMAGSDSVQLTIKGKTGSTEADALVNGAKAKCAFSLNGNQVFAKLTLKNEAVLALQGIVERNEGKWSIAGAASDFAGKEKTLYLIYADALKPDTTKPEVWPDVHVDSLLLLHPFGSYGRRELPRKEQVLIRNAKVWTCSDAGIQENTSLLIDNGKIRAIGNETALQKLVNPSRPITTIDGTGKHVSPGIIDEHSHIALSRGVNEGTQNNTAEVRMGDALNAGDVDIYRQLAGGVTAAQLLHGSANPIGGQSALIKFRWGMEYPGLLIENAPKHIKFALGENVKQSNWGDSKTTRFPQTRMGVEQVFYDAFQRAKEYRKAQDLASKAGKNAEQPARDLELEALAEILEGKRNITCHSYVQSEINMLMHVADSMGFKVNTFTHILEGYKLADKMKKHGANGSTFSDWWAYKLEVNDAIPYNGSIMHEMGIVTAYNSDDAEMGRRLNQEAGKAVLYGKTPEEEALKFVTRNPAVMLKLDGFTGSLKVGNDADLVIWSDNPLSVYARAERTYVDGICYFDLESDKQLQLQNEAIRNRITAKMLREKAGGKPVKTYRNGKKHYYTCDDLFNLTEETENESE